LRAMKRRNAALAAPQVKPTPGFEPGSPSLRVKWFADVPVATAHGATTSV